ncbi:unnamed protein product [Ostreobium quekettii]|uniref:V-type proton ATPase subunit H n=1 Tax=Ostreobium quekettii TaxID=121088 RepID=A0A8S1IQL5_9CHLO|nr:unnamed protein product [Ostreobium quekettii]|eukprot:evm.model.scf_566.2 EVM.evm.TU.scf_566.2   scf_566:14189-15625(-)
MAFSSMSGREADGLDASDILQQDIPWAAYMTAKLISDKDLQLITRYDKQTPDVRAHLLEEDGPAYVEAFMTVLRNTTKEQVVQYVLATLDEMVIASPASVALFHTQSDVHLSRPPEPYGVLMRHLSRADWFTQEKACRLLSAVLGARPDKAASIFASEHNPLTPPSQPEIGAGVVADQAIFNFMDWLTSQLRRPTNSSRSVAVATTALAGLLRERGARKLFHKSGGVPLLAPLLRAGTTGQRVNVQLLYEACLCVWLLSYMRETVKAIKDCGIARYLVGIVRANFKEKVTRVALNGIKNLLSSEEVDVTPDVVDAGLPKLVTIRLVQNWEDKDIVETLEWLEEKLRSGIAVISTFDKYKSEILSGRLEWGPIHTEEAFWRQNVHHLEEKEFHILRVLLRLLEVSREVKTLAVGCHDLGQFVSHHPHGRGIVIDLRGKEIVMGLMRHSDPEVQKNALLCVQKIMLSKDKLDFLSGPVRA